MNEHLETLKGIEATIARYHKTLSGVEEKIPLTAAEDIDHPAQILQVLGKSINDLRRLIQIVRQAIQLSSQTQAADPGIYPRLSSAVKQCEELSIHRGHLMLVVWQKRFERAVQMPDPHDLPGLNLARGRSLGQIVTTYSALADSAFSFLLTHQPSKNAVTHLTNAIELFHQFYATSDDIFIITHRKESGVRTLYRHARLLEIALPETRWGRKDDYLKALPSVHAEELAREIYQEFSLDLADIPLEMQQQFCQILANFHRQCDVVDSLNIRRKLAPNTLNADVFYNQANILKGVLAEFRALVSNLLNCCIKEEDQRADLLHQLEARLTAFPAVKQSSCLNEACHILLTSKNVTLKIMALAYRYFKKELEAVDAGSHTSQVKRDNTLQACLMKTIWFANNHTLSGFNYSMQCLNMALPIVKSKQYSTENKMLRILFVYT